MRTLRDIKILENVPVLVRAALNVPIQDGKVANAYRLEQAAATFRYLAEHNARIVVISHIGEQGTETLAPVANALKKIVPNVSFCSETIGPRVRSAIRDLLPGQILVLENLRRNKGEVGNDPAFAKELATLADVFVQDSFDTCHRVHASIVGIPEFLPSYAGLQLESEIKELSVALSPRSPALAVIGGAKFSTKEPVLSALLKKYDRLFVGGALANDFLKAAGHNIGKSLTSDVDATKMATLLRNPKLVLPDDVVVVKEKDFISANPRVAAQVRAVDGVEDDEIIVDAGPATSAQLAELCGMAWAILWNGPLGNFEKGFGDATENLAKAVAASDAHSVIGGGDTIAAIEPLGLMPKFSFVSTGGGAMLQFLAEGSLPGITALH